VVCEDCLSIFPSGYSFIFFLDGTSGIVFFTRTL
jgi:hypothetical protein